MLGNREHLVATAKAPVKFVPFFPVDVDGNMGQASVWFEHVAKHVSNTNIKPTAWYIFVANMDRGIAHVGTRDLLPDKSIVLSGYGYYGTSVQQVAGFRRDRDIVIPNFKKEGHGEIDNKVEASEAYFREETKRGELLFFEGNIGENSPECSGDLLLRNDSDCDRLYSQGVREYVVNKYQRVAGFKLGKDYIPGEIHRYINEMTTAKFCLVAGGNGFDMRLITSIDHGCVPLLTERHTSQPLEHVFRYDTFSLRVDRRELPNLKMTLEAVTEAEHGRMVANLWHIRKAFSWIEGANGVQGRPMAFYHILTAVAIVTGLDLPPYVKGIICTEHSEEFMLSVFTREAQKKVLPCSTKNGNLSPIQ